MTVTSEVDDALGFLRTAQPLHERRKRWRMETLQLGLRLTEMVVFFLAGLVVAAWLPSSLGGLGGGRALLAASAATVAAIEIGRPRRAMRPRPAILLLQAFAASATGGLILVLAELSWRVGLAWSVGELIGTTVILASIHFLYVQAVDTLLADGRLATYVAVLGTGPAARRLHAGLASGDMLPIKVVGCYAVDEEKADFDGARGTLRTLLSDCRLEFVDAVVIAPEPGDGDTVAGLRHALRACLQDVYLASDTEAPAPGLPRAMLGRSEVVLLGRRPISGGAALAKRLFDLAGALALLAFLAPLLGLLALAITLDSRGPILFRQLRVGYNNRLFHILKFRSMRSDAADRLAKQQTVRDDTRVTRVGRIIRRLSLDELPQLLNVVRGEMSLVGPRPHAPGTSVGGQRIHTIVDDYARRHLVRPGITGLAQVRGLRGGLQDRHQVAARLAADLEYMERWSIWLDIRILLGTIVLELRQSRGC